MSQHIGDVASYPLNNPDSMGPGREPAIGVGTYWGGEHGLCVQLTMGSRFVQIDAAGVDTLIRYLACAAKDGHKYSCIHCGSEHDAQYEAHES